MIYVGIPTIDCLEYLKGAVGSVVCDYPTKIMIIDNGSDENTKSWIRNSDHLFTFNPTNYGVAKSWNQILYWGMSYDDCEVIFVLNNDIVLHPDSMNNMVESILEYGKEGISGVNIGNDLAMLEVATKPINRYSPAMNFSCFGLTVKTIKRVGFFDENFKVAYFEDNDYHHRMQLEGLDASCDLWAPFVHFGSITIRTGKVNHTSAFQENKRYFQNKWGFLP